MQGSTLIESNLGSVWKLNISATPEPVTEIDGSIAREFFTILNNAQPYTEDQCYNVFTFSALHSWLNSLYNPENQRKGLGLRQQLLTRIESPDTSPSEPYECMKYSLTQFQSEQRLQGNYCCLLSTPDRSIQTPSSAKWVREITFNYCGRSLSGNRTDRGNPLTGLAVYY